MRITDKGNKVKVRLLESGLNLLSEHSYHSIGVNQVIDVAGLSKGSFYHYFSSKEEFAAEVVKYGKIIEISHKEDLGSIADIDELKEIVGLFNRLINEYELDSKYMGTLFTNNAGQLCKDSPALRDALDNSISETQDRISQLLKQAQDKGKIRQDLSARRIAEFFLDSWHGAILRMQVEQSVTPLRQVVEFIFDDFVCRTG